MMRPPRGDYRHSEVKNEKFFSKTPSIGKATPSRGQKPFLDWFLGEGAWLTSRNKKIPLPRVQRVRKQAFEGTDLGLGALTLCSLLRPSQTHGSLACDALYRARSNPV